MTGTDKRRKFIVTKLKSLELNKMNMFDQLIKINNETKGLYNRGLANVHTLDIVRKEISSLEAKLVENETAITFFQGVLRKEYLADSSDSSLAELKKGDLKYFDCSSTSTAKDVDLSFRLKTEQRLHDLERKVASFDSKKSSDDCARTTKLEALVQEKEEAIELFAKLNSKYNERDAITNQEVIDLREKLANTSKIADEMTNKNQKLSKQLRDYRESRDLMNDAAKFESKIKSRDDKINSQAQEIKNLKKRSVDVSFTEKYNQAKEELLAAEKQIELTKVTVSRQKRELENAFKEKNLLDEEAKKLREEQENLKIETKVELKEFYDTNKILTSEKDELVNKLRDIEMQKSELEKELGRFMYEKVVLKERLKILEDQHKVCGRNMRELERSNTESLQDTRRQMEQLLNEEAGLSRHLEEKVKEQAEMLEKQVASHNEEVTQLNNQLVSKDEQVNGLRKQLSNVRENHQTEMNAKVTIFNAEMEEKIKELELCKDQTEGQINDFKKNNSKLAKENEKLKIKNNSLKADLVEKIELDKVQKERIATLQEQLNISKQKTKEAVDEKVIKLSQELAMCQEKYNDSIVDCDVMSREFHKSKSNVGAYQKQIEELKKMCAELDISVKTFELKSTSESSELVLAKKKLAVQSGVIEKLLKERCEDEAKIKVLVAESPKAKKLQKDQALSKLDVEDPKASNKSRVPE